MRKITAFFLVLSLVLMFSACASFDTRDDSDDSDEKLNLAVMEFEDRSGDFSKETLSNATEYIRSAFVASNKFIVVAKERQEKEMIKQMKEASYQDCNDKKCQIPLGKALSADTILRTTITFFGGSYRITSELIDLAKEATTKGAKQDFDNHDETSLKRALDRIVLQITGKRVQNKYPKIPDEEPPQPGSGGDNPEVIEEVIVTFESNPNEAVVYADGKILCQSTPCKKSLTPDLHEIKMEKENYLPTSKREKIKEGKTIKYNLDPDFAWLSVTGIHDSEIKLDGKNIGQIPIQDKIIAPGNHTIEPADTKCFIDSGEKFIVKRGEKKNIKFNLAPRKSTIKVHVQDKKGDDTYADVYVDDKKVGRAPGTFDIPLCSKKLVVEKKNYETYSRKLSLKEMKIKTFDVSLNPEKARPKIVKRKKKRDKLDVRTKRLVTATSFFVPGVLIATGGGFAVYYMNKAKNDREYYYEEYLKAKSSSDIEKYSEKTKKADKNFKTYKVLGGLGVGLGVAMITTGFIFYIVNFDGEKEVKSKYRLSFGANPADTNIYFTLNW